MDIETMTGGQKHHPPNPARGGAGKFEVKHHPVETLNRTCKSLEDHPVKLVKHTVELLKESEAVMYGHEQCGYCKKQVELFTKPTEDRQALRGIYVNCKDEPDKCDEIRGFPTWNIAGKDFVGLHEVSDLCQIAELAVEDKNESLPPPKPTCKLLADDPQKLTAHTLELLHDTDATFYGHDQCKFCKKQTDLFEKHSDEKRPLKDIYVNCKTDPKQCTNISGYPTWEIAGKTFVGYHDMKDLCQIAELAVEDKAESLGHR